MGTVSVPDEATVRALDPAAARAFGITAPSTVTRKQAMKVPGIRRGRNLIAGTIGTLPLVLFRKGAAGAEPVDSELLDVLDPATVPSYIIAWTVDDLIFEGVSWWRVTARDVDGWPAAVERLVGTRVRVDVNEGKVYVDGKPADDADLIRFDALDEGLLRDDSAGVIVRLALALLESGRRNAEDDVPSMILSLVAGARELLPEEVVELLDEWEAARKARRTAYTNAAVDARTVSHNAGERQLTELSELVASELARLMNLPASRIGAPQGSGMTYSNTESDRRDLVDTTLALYLTPIRQRLSKPDVTRPGEVVMWDLTSYLRGTTTEIVAAGKVAIEAGITDAGEVRTDWLGMRPRTDLPKPAAPATQPAEDNA